MRGIDRMLSPLRRGLAHIVSRAVVTLVNDAARMQTLQLSLLADEQLDGAEHWQPYGFTYKPHTGAEALVVAIGGHRAHSVVIACADRRYRLTDLEDGEVAIYTDEGDRIHFKRGRIIDIQTGTLNIKATDAVNIDTPVITQTGRIESTGDQIAAGISQIEHTHGGVQRGSDTSDAAQ
ncbi:phage baseplate assembly protein V [Pseudomonas sp. Q2-TVG4-2]|uniref:phage baseplate assembly protein V n=1 Tax=Pseudomonas sp. Q2-TVG4-2 TaxID=1685699 RepID=UPI002159DA28|nr:phage baseplate assembly protein V [Pseudomonas sp. Q2-TVG4-2]